MYKTVFLDRDGTINEEVRYLHKAEDFKLLPGVAKAIRLWNENGFRVVVVTNQAGVARGYYREEDVIRLHRHMEQLLAGMGARIDGCYYCPHHPEHGIGSYKVKCRCRKPGTGMFEHADAVFPVAKAHSYMVGDKWLDTQAGANFGLKTVLVGTGYGRELYEERKRKEDKENKEAQEDQAAEVMDYFAETLYDAAIWILRQENLRLPAGGGNEFQA